MDLIPELILDISDTAEERQQFEQRESLILQALATQAEIILEMETAIKRGKLECIAESPLNFRALSRLHSLALLLAQIMDQVRVVGAISGRPDTPLDKLN